MKSKEILNEIGQTTICPKLNWKSVYLQDAILITSIEGHKIFKISDNKHDYYIIADSNTGELQAYIAVEKSNDIYLPLVRIENIAGIGGLATMIIVALIAVGFKFKIKADENLTLSGFKWLIKLIKKNGSGLKLFTQTGKFPDIKILRKEWFDSFDTNKVGPTEIFIENKSIDLKKLNEDSTQWNDDNILLKPYYFYFKNDELL